MSRRTTAALLLLPTLALSSTAEASALCDQLTARLAQMPQVIGAPAQAASKANSQLELNRMEQAVRHDMRQLQCPSDSVITIGADNQAECDGLREQLSGIRQQLADLEAYQPLLTHTVDDGSGLSTALVKQMQVAGCDITGSQLDVETFGSTSNAMPQQMPVEVSVSDGNDATGEQQQLAALFQQDPDQTNDMPEGYGMIDLTGRDMKAKDEPKAKFIELPDLKVQILRPQMDPKSTDMASMMKPEASLRDYDPMDRHVRRVGPAFLPDQDDGIDLHNPKDGSAEN